MSFLVPTVSPRTVARLSGAAAGAAVAALAFVDTQRMVWRMTAEDCQAFGTYKPLPRSADEEAFFGPKTRALAVRAWNRAVDGSIGALATELAKRGL